MRKLLVAFNERMLNHCLKENIAPDSEKYLKSLY